MKIAISIITAFAFLCVPSIASAEPCPPKHYFCWQAKWAFKQYGVHRVIAKARACGWNAEEVAEALKCRK